jgi:Zn-dependent peptidase ImmA (M78 family)
MTTSDNSLKKRLNFEFIPESRIETAANRLRYDYQQDSGKKESRLDPVNAIWDYLYAHPQHNLRLEIETPLGLDTNGDVIAGRTTVEREQDEGSDGGCIYIDPAIVRSPLYIFTLAHELGHWILHRGLMIQARCQGNLFNPTVPDIVTLQRNVGSDARKEKQPTEEWQANTFAAYLLMPKAEVSVEFQKRYGSDSLVYQEKRNQSSRFRSAFSTLREYARCIAGEGGENNSSLAETFGVSKESMAIRLEQLQLVVNDVDHTSRLL